MKEFLLLLRENIDVYKQLSPEEMQKDIEKHVKWVESLARNGNYKTGSPLEAGGSTLRGKIVTDGPFIESKEGVSGYYFLLANSLEEATKIAQDCPTLESGGTVEVRPIMAYGSDGQ